jgi:hypothetical protein
LFKEPKPGGQRADPLFLLGVTAAGRYGGRKLKSFGLRLFLTVFGGLAQLAAVPGPPAGVRLCATMKITGETALLPLHLLHAANEMNDVAVIFH